MFHHNLSAAGGLGPFTTIYGITDTIATPSFNSTTFTASGAALGTAYSDREIFVALMTMETLDISTVVNSITIGGNAGDFVLRHEPVIAGNNTIGAHIVRYRDNGALGATADIVVGYAE